MHYNQTHPCNCFLKSLDEEPYFSCGDNNSCLEQFNNNFNQWYDNGCYIFARGRIRNCRFVYHSYLYRIFIWLCCPNVSLVCRICLWKKEKSNWLNFLIDWYYNTPFSNDITFNWMFNVLNAFWILTKIWNFYGYNFNLFGILFFSILPSSLLWTRPWIQTGGLKISNPKSNKKMVNEKKIIKRKSSI